MEEKMCPFCSSENITSVKKYKNTVLNGFDCKCNNCGSTYFEPINSDNEIKVYRAKDPMPSKKETEEKKERLPYWAIEILKSESKI